ncbi:hypothetical protein FRC12_010309 [Ceratobasidium sp. 428]|nr:hypothetical protein FRC12_010309 [Ceratobasidium sp. 428]
MTKPPKFVPCEQVFRTLELAFLVFAYLEVDDLTRLLSTCKVIFHSAAASRWKHATSAMPLLRLLPCAEIGTLRGLYGYHRTKGRNFVSRHPSAFPKSAYPRPPKQTFQKSLFDSDFQRFNVYAPYITRLDLYQAPDIPVTISGWKALLDYVDSGRILLPNLVTLSIDSQDGRRGMLPYPWIAAFAHPSLRHLYVGRSLGVSQHVGCAILDHVTRLCPDLTSLELHVVHGGVEEQDELVLPKLDMIRVDWVGEFFRAARCLESLATSSYVFDVYLHHISQLPLLRRLEVHHHGVQDKLATYLFDERFPSLCELQLSGFEMSEAESLWTMPPLVKNITTLEVFQTTYVDPDSDSILSVPVIIRSPEGLVSTLLSGCPKLTVLRLEFEEDRELMRMDEPTLRLLSRYPLRELTFRKMAPAIGVENRPMDLIASLFPELEVFQWQKLHVSYDQLHHTLKMPKLRHLAVFAQPWRIGATVLRRLPWPSNTPKNTELKIFESMPAYYDAESWFRTMS